jgi:heterotetrameric sarcosine oxidase gamma subunit
VADLKATPAVGGLPVIFGRMTLEAVDTGPVTSIAPFPGSDPKTALSALGLTFPKPGTMNAHGAARIFWAGRDLAFLMGADAPDALSVDAALTDQTDGWVWLHLSGPDARAVLARLTPLDLRDAAFAVGHSARSMISHMQAIMLRPAPDAYDVAVFRSMAGTVVHEMTEAMATVAARAQV